MFLMYFQVSENESETIFAIVICLNNFIVTNIANHVFFKMYMIFMVKRVNNDKSSIYFAPKIRLNN